jgi:hypothetical protein
MEPGFAFAEATRSWTVFQPRDGGTMRILAFWPIISAPARSRAVS